MIATWCDAPEPLGAKMRPFRLLLCEWGDVYAHVMMPYVSERQAWQMLRNAREVTREEAEKWLPNLK